MFNIATCIYKYYDIELRKINSKMVFLELEIDYFLLLISI